MNSILKAILHFGLIFFIQTLLLKSLGFTIGGMYIAMFIFPAIIVIMPFDWEPWVGLLIAFGLGLLTDLFYNSPGVFGSAGVFAAFIRPLALSINEPKTGYGREISPVIDSMGWVWFLRFGGIVIFSFVLFYFFALSPQFSKLGVILLQALVSLPLSMIFVLLYVLIFNPRI